MIFLSINPFSFVTGQYPQFSSWPSRTDKATLILVLGTIMCWTKMSVVSNLAAQWSQNGPGAVLNPNIPEATNKSLKDVCRDTYAEETTFLESNFTAPFCKVSFDRVSCWPPTPANTTAVIKCMAYLNNIRYDDTRKFYVCEWTLKSFIMIGLFNITPLP